MKIITNWLLTIIITYLTIKYCQCYEDDVYEHPEPREGAPGQTPKAKLLNDTIQINEFINSDDQAPKVIAYFDLTTNLNDKEEFDKILKDDEHIYRFAYVTDKHVLEELKYDGCAVFVYPPIKYVSTKYEKTKYRYSAKNLKKEPLQRFIRLKSMPLVGERNYENDIRYDLVTQIPHLALFTEIDMDKNPKGFQYLTNRLRKIAVKYVNKLLFYIADKTKYSQDTEYYGLTNELTNRKDVAVGIKNGMFYYKMKKSFSIDNVQEFITNFFNGDIIGTERIDKEPEDEDKGLPKETEFTSDVIELTNENFDKIVNYNDHDILIDFYAPWCGHCKQLKSVINAVAKKFKNDPNVVIASFDATVHDIPKGYDVQGYPTLYFVSGNKRKAVNYEGQRDLDSLVSYIDYHRKTKAP